jgi:hypothetical protein
MTRHLRHRRDNNHGELIRIAEQLGACYLPDGPCDGWLHWRGSWNLLEIKNPNCEGHKDEYTPEQIRLFARLKERGIRWWVWRVEGDVYRDLGARRVA